ncbi:hypothetical protein BC828DRAFT_378911 [Blastocladiella britannica]|nr:hypothetical protein BC828DRAFT_378911 [Blastocladiella britannica]
MALELIPDRFQPGGSFGQLWTMAYKNAPTVCARTPDVGNGLGWNALPCFVYCDGTPSLLNVGVHFSAGTGTQLPLWCEVDVTAGGFEPKTVRLTMPLGRTNLGRHTTVTECISLEVPPPPATSSPLSGSFSFDTPAPAFGAFVGLVAPATPAAPVTVAATPAPATPAAQSAFSFGVARPAAPRVTRAPRVFAAAPSSLGVSHTFTSIAVQVRFPTHSNLGSPTRPLSNILSTLNDASLCDCSFLPGSSTTEGDPIHASRAILASVSPYFTSMLKTGGPWAESEAVATGKPIALPDWQPWVLVLVLLHAYSGWIPGQPLPSVAVTLLTKYDCKIDELSVGDYWQLHTQAQMLDMYQLAAAACIKCGELSARVAAELEARESAKHAKAGFGGAFGGGGFGFPSPSS